MDALATYKPAVRPMFGGPNAFVRWALFLSLFAIPFAQLYVPGTGERVGVVRIVQLLIFVAVVSQPRICCRFVPLTLIWFTAYCAVRITWGLWLSPELSVDWWPSTLQWLEFFLPWLWVMFNLLQFPGIGRSGLWAFASGCSLCALLHVAGIGATDVGNGDEGRSSVFGQNANVIGATYGLALIALAGLGMLRKTKWSERILLIGLAAVVGTGLAKTGSRTGVLIGVLGCLVLLFQARSFLPRAQRYAMVLLLGAIAAVILYQIPLVVKRFETVTSSSLHDDEARARMIPVLWEIFLRHPIYGSGPDQYQFELTRRAMPYLVQEQRTISAHNLALLLLVETGVIGFVLVCLGLKEALAAAWRARLGSAGFLPLALILPMLVAGAISSNPSSSPVFWLGVAYALAGGGVANEG